MRTKFDYFLNENKCKKDRQYLIEENKQNKQIVNIVNSCSIVHVDNPSINITRDDDYEARIVINKNRRERSRNTLLKHLEKVCSKENYKFKTWDKLRNEIAGHMDKIESTDEKVGMLKQSSVQFGPRTSSSIRTPVL